MRVASWLRRRFGQGARPTSRYEREGGNKRKSGAWGGKQDVELVAQALTNHSAARPPEEAQGRGTGVEGIVRLRGSSAAAEHKQHKQPGLRSEKRSVGARGGGKCRRGGLSSQFGTARLGDGPTASRREEYLQTGWTVQDSSKPDGWRSNRLHTAYHPRTPTLPQLARLLAILQSRAGGSPLDPQLSTGKLRRVRGKAGVVV